MVEKLKIFNYILVEKLEKPFEYEQHFNIIILNFVEWIVTFCKAYSSVFFNILYAVM